MARQAPSLNYPREVAYNKAAARAFPFSLWENGEAVGFDNDDTIAVSVRDRSGTVISPSGVTATKVNNTNTVNLVFDTTDTTKYPLAEGYVLTLSMTVDGVLYIREVRFSVVRYPYEPGFGQDAYPATCVPTSDGPDDLSDYTMRGWNEALSFLSTLIAYTRTDWRSGRYDEAWSLVMDRVPASILDAPVDARIRPGLILSREAFDRVVLYEAVCAYYREAIATGAQGTIEALTTYERKLVEAKAQFAATLQYDYDDSGNVATATQQSPVGGFFMRR